MNTINKVTKHQRGFTLIEILVVIGIIAILATIVLIALNPQRQFAQARNSQRTSNVSAILNAIGQKISDNKGVFAGGTPACPAGALAINTASSSITNGAGAVPAAAIALGAPALALDLSCLSPTYIATFPTDPDTAFSLAPYTGYDVSVNATGRVLVCASRGIEPSIVGSAPICIKR